MAKNSAFPILIVVKNADRLSAITKLLEETRQDLIARDWEHIHDRELRDAVHMIIADMADAPAASDVLLRDLRETYRDQPIVLIVKDWQSLRIPEGLSGVDVAPMIPEVVRYKIDMLLSVFKHEALVTLKEKKVDLTRERLEMEMRFHKETERILRENEQTLRRIFLSIEATSEAIVLTEKSEVIYYANPAFEKLTGHAVSDVFGAAADDYFDLHNPDISITEMKAIARAGGSWQGDVTLKRKDGVLYQAYMDINAVFNPDGEFEGFVFIQRDITTLKKLMGELEVLARNDSLTGLYNRRYFMERFDEELIRVKRYNHAMSLLIVDLDRFKLINDNYGHAMGDMVLSRLGRLIREKIRTTDFAARYGGEEFCLALPETGLDGAVCFADRLRESLSEITFTCEKGDTFKATCSIGVVELDAGSCNISERFQSADEALYRAKKAGRNRVEVATKAAQN